MLGPATVRTRWSIAVALAIALIVTYLLRHMLLPFVAAGALAYVARPVIQYLQARLGFPRWLAALIPYIAFLVLLVAAGWWVVHVLIPELGQVMRDFQGTLTKFLETLFGANLDLFGRHLTAKDAATMTVERLRGFWQTNVEIIASDLIAIMMGLILTFVVLAFLMFNGPALAAGLLWLIPPHLRPKFRALAVQVDPMLGSYLRGVFVIVAFTIIATYIVTGLVFHLPHAILLAIGVGLLETVPVLGPILSFVAFGLIVVQQRSFGTIIGFGVFAIALRIAIDQLVAPLVLGRAAKIPALVVIFSFLAGGTIFGILGIILAIPAAATVKIVLTNLYEGEPSMGESEPDPLPPSG
jgi:predicted PurR-regulated permease PerM